MIRHTHLGHVFVDNIPMVIEPSTLYISMEYGTAAHECCCGCGEEVITPLTPTDWSLNYDGASISLHPSIGNWDIPCRSHYIIKRGRVIEAGAWADEQIESERARDKRAKSKYYITSDTALENSVSNDVIPARDYSSRWDNFKKFIRKWFWAE